MIGLPSFTDRKEQLNIITKSNPDTQRYNVGVEFTNFPNVNMHNISWALQELGYEDGELNTNG